jgi:hypothetical protein
MMIVTRVTSHSTRERAEEALQATGAAPLLVGARTCSMERVSPQTALALS